MANASSGSKLAAYMDAIPDLSSTNTELNSYTVCGLLPSPASPVEPISARLSWSRQNGSSLALSSRRTKTPLVWSAGGHALILDCKNSSILVVTNIYPHATFRLREGRTDYLYGLHSRDVGHQIDLRSIAAAYDRELRLKSGDSKQVLSGASPSGRSMIRIAFSNSDAVVFAGFEIRTADDRHELLNSIESVSVNDAKDLIIAKPRVHFPEAIATESLDAKALSSKGLQMLSIKMHESLVFHAALEEPSLRTQVSEKYGLNGIDWKACEERYRELAAILRKRFTEDAGAQADSGNLESQL